MTNERFDVIISRPILQEAVKNIPQLPEPLNEDIAIFLISQFEGRIPFESEDAILKESLADFYLKIGEPRLATEQLTKIRVDSSHRFLSLLFLINKEMTIIIIINKYY